jgi:hypothetical protein
MTGVQPYVLNRIPFRRPRCAVSGSPVMRASSGLAPTIRQPLILCKLHGRVAAPTFFWGGETTRAKRNLLYANRLILMGVWRDPSQPGTEETGALSYCSRILKSNPAAQAVVGRCCSLDTGSLMGVITIRKLSKPVMVISLSLTWVLHSFQCLHASASATGLYVASVLRST